MTLNNAFCTEKNIFLIEKNPAASEEQRKKAQEDVYKRQVLWSIIRHLKKPKHGLLNCESSHAILLRMMWIHMGFHTPI